MAAPRDPPRTRRATQTPAAATPEAPLGVQAESAPDNALQNAISDAAASSRGAVGTGPPNSTRENTLAPETPTGARQRRETPARAEETPATDAAQQADVPNRSAERGVHALPEAVKARYLKVGDDYHFVNGRLAFRDAGERLSTPLENSEVIRDLMAIAQERGWKQIMLSGSARFRSEAYQQARLAGLDVPGYTPDETERQQLAHRMRQTGERQNAAPAPGALDAATPPGPPERPTERPVERIYRGRLLDHGAAHYRFDPREDASYFVLLETERGEEYVWGKDLGRALESSLSRATEGQAVVVRHSGSEPVTVSRHVRDGDGRVTGEQAVRTLRHRWSIETQDFLAEREQLAAVVRDPRITPTQGVSNHPELAGTYDELYAAKLVAANQPFTKEEAERFVGRVRESIAQEIERGEPLSPPVQRARFRGEAASPRTHQQVQERVL